MARSAVDLDHDYASGLRPPITYDIVMESGIDLVGTTIMTWHFNFELGFDIKSKKYIRSTFNIVEHLGVRLLYISTSELVIHVTTLPIL